ncbi:Nuclear pore glycoprotein [Nesidiocoris tenuis]|uniref:Nuclear pore glycoprotein n=1 Tax=Nesidiocoris tenuis TaxID=355587 RepID=A0ABN7B8B9_9HEMI|nr:Nuclear pore glycoprotein [Nesidiocoris tenuis]
MKRISEDLKEVIEQTNEASRNIDSSDPVLQVGRVLNAQMDWLHIIDESSSRIQESLDSISKMHNRLKKDPEHPSLVELM